MSEREFGVGQIDVPQKTILESGIVLLRLCMRSTAREVGLDHFKSKESMIDQPSCRKQEPSSYERLDNATRLWSESIPRVAHMTSGCIFIMGLVAAVFTLAVTITTCGFCCSPRFFLVFSFDVVPDLQLVTAKISFRDFGLHHVHFHVLKHGFLTRSKVCPIAGLIDTTLHGLQNGRTHTLARGAVGITHWRWGVKSRRQSRRGWWPIHTRFGIFRVYWLALSRLGCGGGGRGGGNGFFGFAGLARHLV
mmetsp:Transcript_9318/g.28214  ORF Transcript_9318/g.28214 Transcript_9318/m.28214 type:complete len:249 (+) Transcript_9318:239-985(+)